jgi:hypothetical protein
MEKQNLVIIATKQTLFISSILKQWFSTLYNQVSVLEELTEILPNHVYFFFCIFLIHKRWYPLLKNNYIIYQLEQHTNGNLSGHYRNMETCLLDWFYENARMTFDYCQQNVDFLESYLSCSPAKKPKLLEIPFINNFKTIITNRYSKPIDILFCGCINSRRKEILSFLFKRYRVQVVTNQFFKELLPYFSQSKILLNIHYYDNAILERVRINEGLYYGLPVVSELPCETDMNCVESLYKDLVSFVPMMPSTVTLQSMEPLFQAIDNNLKQNVLPLSATVSDSLEASSHESFLKHFTAASS